MGFPFYHLGDGKSLSDILQDSHIFFFAETYGRKNLHPEIPDVLNQITSLDRRSQFLMALFDQRASTWFSTMVIIYGNARSMGLWATLFLETWNQGATKSFQRQAARWPMVSGCIKIHDNLLRLASLKICKIRIQLGYNLRWYIPGYIQEYMVNGEYDSWVCPTMEYPTFVGTLP